VSRQRGVCKFVAGRYSLTTQRRANEGRANASARTSVGSHIRPTRWLTKLPGGTIEWSWRPLLAPRRRTCCEPDQVFD